MLSKKKIRNKIDEMELDYRDCKIESLTQALAEWIDSYARACVREGLENLCKDLVPNVPETMFTESGRQVKRAFDKALKQLEEGK